MPMLCHQMTPWMDHAPPPPPSASAVPAQPPRLCRVTAAHCACALPLQDADGPAVPGQAEDRMRKLKFKGKRAMRVGPNSQVVQQQQQLQQSPGFNALPGATDSAAQEREDDLVQQIEFEQRVKALAAESEARRRQAQQAADRPGGVLDTTAGTVPRRGAQRVGGDGGDDDNIYANVQPLSKTLMPGADDSGAAKEYESSQLGPGQVRRGALPTTACFVRNFCCCCLPPPPLASLQAGLTVAAVALGAVFLLTSGGGADFAPSSSRRAASPTSQQQSAALSEEARRDLEKQLAEVEAQLAAGGGDEALEAAAVLNARLGHYPAAEAQLVRLAAAKPQDGEVQRVLAEAQAAQGEWEAAVGSYKKAWEDGGRRSLEVLQGLAGALVAGGKEAAAVEAVLAAQAAGGSDGIGAVELQLLAGRTYAQWRGHVPDALAVYDALIAVGGVGGWAGGRSGRWAGAGVLLPVRVPRPWLVPLLSCRPVRLVLLVLLVTVPPLLPAAPRLQSSPDDFRAYLAKGLLLNQQGRAGDAERYFMQARFHATNSNRQVVDQIIQARSQ